MSTKINSILEKIDEKDYHMAEMLWKSTIVRLRKAKKDDEILTLLKSVIEKLLTCNESEIKEVIEILISEQQCCCGSY